MNKRSIGSTAGDYIWSIIARKYNRKYVTKVYFKGGECKTYRCNWHELQDLFKTIISTADTIIVDLYKESATGESFSIEKMVPEQVDKNSKEKIQYKKYRK